MKLFRTTATDFAKGSKGKQLLQQAKTCDTPENRRKATEMLGKLRGRNGRAA